MTARVKICGLSRPEHARVAAEAGADLIGLVFAESRRRVTPDAARVVIDATKAFNPRIRAVGLFVDADAATIARVYGESGIDLVQLHGMPTPDVIEAIGLPVLIAVRHRPGDDRERLFDYIDSVLGLPVVEMILLDAYHPTLAGGTGTLADWSLAADLARRAPLILAGGLNPENVGEAIESVRPAAVDVSSGVELDGAKDADLIRRFLQRAHAAFAANGAYSISSGTSSHDAP